MPPKRVRTRSQSQKAQPVKKQKTEKAEVKITKKVTQKVKKQKVEERQKQDKKKSKIKRISTPKEQPIVLKKNYIKSYQVEDYALKLGSHAIVKIEKSKRQQKSEDESSSDLYDQGFSVVQIQKIYTQGDENTYFQVQWYVTPKEVKINNKCIGKDEIFFTDKVSIIDQSSIDTPCFVWSLEKYEEEERKNRKKSEKEKESLLPYYFTRAQWIEKIRKLEPDWKEWEPIYCICKQPANPDRTYLQCVKCSDWFHTDCIGIDDKEEGQLKKLPDYICEQCQKRQAKVEKRKNSFGAIQRQTRSKGEENVVEEVEEKKKKTKSGEEKKAKQTPKKQKQNSEESQQSKQNESQLNESKQSKGKKNVQKGNKQAKGKKQESKKVEPSQKDTPEAIESNIQQQEQLSPTSPQIKQQKESLEQENTPADQVKQTEEKAGGLSEVLANKLISKKREEETTEIGQNN